MPKHKSSSRECLHATKNKSAEGRISVKMTALCSTLYNRKRFVCHIKIQMAKILLLIKLVFLKFGKNQVFSFSINIRSKVSEKKISILKNVEFNFKINGLDIFSFGKQTKEINVTFNT